MRCAKRFKPDFRELPAKSDMEDSADLAGMAVTKILNDPSFRAKFLKVTLFTTSCALPTSATMSFWRVVVVAQAPFASFCLSVSIKRGNFRALRWGC